nr:Ubiquitin carboxyl-terminal hydrolase-related protein isoform 1 [Ipomoea batatas]
MKRKRSRPESRHHRPSAVSLSACRRLQLRRQTSSVAPPLLVSKPAHPLSILSLSRIAAKLRCLKEKAVDRPKNHTRSPSSGLKQRPKTKISPAQQWGGFSSLCERKCEHFNYEEATSTIYRFEIEAISSVLKDAESLSNYQFGFEDTYGGISSQLCFVIWNLVKMMIGGWSASLKWRGFRRKSGGPPASKWRGFRRKSGDSQASKWREAKAVVNQPSKWLESENLFRCLPAHQMVKRKETATTKVTPRMRGG